MKTNAARLLDQLGIAYELQILLAPADYLRATRACIGPLSRPKS